MKPQDSLQLAKSYVKKTMQGAGAIKGKDGKDGISPDIEVTETDKEYIIHITDANSDDEIKLPKGGSGSNSPINFEDLTPEQKAMLKGEKGDAFTYDDFTEEQILDLKGTDGIDGVTFIPSVDEDGNLSWSNESGLDNPETKNIKGNAGVTFTPSVSTDGVVSWSNNGGLDNPLPINIKGTKGDDGYPFLIYKEYSSIDMFNADDFPQIGLMFLVNIPDESGLPVYRFTNEGTGYSMICHLANEGIKGEKGDAFKYEDFTGDQLESLKGDKGDTGATPTFSIGAVSTIPSDQVAKIELKKTEVDGIPNYAFEFSIPKGANYNLTLEDKSKIAEMVATMIDVAEGESY